MLCEWSRLPDNAIPLPGLVVVHSVQVVRHQVEGVLEPRHLDRDGYRVELETKVHPKVRNRPY